MSFGSTRKYTCAALVLATAMALAAVPANAAQFTPGNIVVAGVPNTAGNQQITLYEFTSAGGAAVQSYTIPNSGTTPFGGTTGTSFTQPQINFGDDSNQLIYASTAFTNSTAGSAGYVRVNASSGTVAIDYAQADTRGAVESRGVTQARCRAFTSHNTAGVDRSTNGAPFEQLVATGNGRYLEHFQGNIYVSTGSTGYPGSTVTGIRLIGAASVPAPASPSAFLDSPGGQVLGFYIASPTVVYLTITTGNASAPWNVGVHKATFNGSLWTDEGINTTIGIGTGGDLFDIDGRIDGGNVTLYVAQGANLWRIDDTLGSTGATWTGATTTNIATLTAPSRAKSLAIVPAAVGPQSFNVTTAVNPGASGTVTKNPPTGPYAKCSTVQLTATAAGGFVFQGWSGDASGSANPLDVVVDSDKNITANFSPTAGNSVLTVSGTGNGQVDVAPPGSTLVFPGGPYNVVQPTGTFIQLDAFADSGYVFDRWTGSLAPAPPNDESSGINIQLNANGTLVANFKQLYQVRVFTTGNGTNAITGGDPNDGNPAAGVFLYRQGKNIQFTATAGNVGSPATPWTFVRHADAALATLSTNATYTFTNISANLDDTAEFVETPLNGAPQAWTAGNVIVATIQDFTFPGVVNLREYNKNGELVQPPVVVPSTGLPSGTVNGPTATSIFDINFDVSNPSPPRLYIAVSDVNDALPNQTGFIRTVFSGGAHTFDLARSNQIAQDGRGVAANGNDVYYSYDGLIRRYDIGSDAISSVISGNTRMLTIFNNALYSSTSSTSTAGTYASGPGIYEILDPNGTPSAIQRISTPILSGINPPGLLSFKFADANNCYVCFTTAAGYANVQKFWFDGSAWVNQGSLTALGVQFGRGVDVKVNGNDVRVYIQSTTATSEGSLGYVDDKLDNSLTWSSLPVTTTVPRVSRGRAVAVVPGSAVPTCATCLGDVNGNNRVDGVDSQGFVGCVIAGGPLTTPCACADMNGSGGVTTADIGPYVTKLLGTGDPNPSCP